MNYFDYAATSPMSVSSLETYFEVAKAFPGNPSAVYSLGQQSKRKLEETRIEVAKALNVKADTIYFTSGGTESNSIIINSLFRLQSPGEIIITRMEHSAISEYEGLLKEKGFKIRYINAPKGFVNPEKLKGMLTSDTRMVICMLVNNVVGSIQNLKEISNICAHFSSSRKIHVHTDAVQALGKIPVDLTELGVDSASFSAHKFCGPRGVGILYNKNDRLLSLSVAGGQEKGFRGGTENLAGVCAMLTSMKIVLPNIAENYAKVKECRNYLAEELTNGGFKLLSLAEGNYSPYILSVTSSAPAEVFVRLLDTKGYCVSSGSACSNNAKNKTETILRAMGFSEKEAFGAIRISFGFNTRMDQIKQLAKVMIAVKRELAI